VVELAVPPAVPSLAIGTLPEAKLEALRLPLKAVAVKVPVDGTNERLDDETFRGIFPELAVTQVGYTEVAVATSFVIAVLVALVAVVAVVAFPLKLAVIVPAVKFPEASLRTIVLALLVAVALFANTVAVPTAIAADPPTLATAGERAVPPRSPANWTTPNDVVVALGIPVEIWVST
jgi:hypothetical protein